MKASQIMKEIATIIIKDDSKLNCDYTLEGNKAKKIFELLQPFLKDVVIDINMNENGYTILSKIWIKQYEK